MSVTQASLLGDTFGSKASGTVPIGGIIMWSGTIESLPTGWLLCNGSNGTPDLRNRFIIGASGDQSSQSVTAVTGVNTKTGGSKDAILVSHSHTTINTIQESNTNLKSLTGTFRNEKHDGAPTGVFSETAQGFREDSSEGGDGRLITMDATHRHQTDTQGSSEINANLPPYYALAFIMRVS